MPFRACTVTFRDHDGVLQTAKVDAETAFEAVALALNSIGDAPPEGVHVDEQRLHEARALYPDLRRAAGSADRRAPHSLTHRISACENQSDAAGRFQLLVHGGLTTWFFGGRAADGHPTGRATGDDVFRRRALAVADDVHRRAPLVRVVAEPLGRMLRRYARGKVGTDDRRASSVGQGARLSPDFTLDVRVGYGTAYPRGVAIFSG